MNSVSSSARCSRQRARTCCSPAIAGKSLKWSPISRTRFEARVIARSAGSQRRFASGSLPNLLFLRRSQQAVPNQNRDRFEPLLLPRGRPCL